ncbi:hypothetical protein MCM47_36630, partial [Kitasatospora sp. A2-31]|nr:hypothetical protein [Kitasatospora sp. A2-31]
PRRGQQQPGPGPRTGEQPQHGWADQSGRPGAPQGAARPGNRPQDGLPQRGRPGQAPQGPGGQGPQGPRRPQRPGPQQQGRPQQLPAQQAQHAQPQQQPQQAQPPQLPAQQAQPQPLPAAESAMESTAQFARPRFEASEIDPRDPLGLGLVEPVLPDVPNPVRPEPVRQEPMALPIGPSQGGAPGFESPEQTRPQPQPGLPAEAAQGLGQQYQPRRPGTTAPGFQDQPAPQAQHPQAPQGPAGEAPWRPSANDERWRRAEQVREPSTSGVTMSGLPRRTPQANLVSGTAEASPMTGPQVSRAPEEVRGRLTNLRRGIQQGRRAGAEQASGQGNPGFHHGAQQPGFDSFGGRTDGNGADHQER